MNLTEEQIDRIAEKVAAKIMRGERSPVLSSGEAMAMAGCNSSTAFWRWCKRLGVRTASRGRYSRSAILNALRREEERGQRRTDSPLLVK